MPTSRPLSPHLGIYRWRVNMLQSTLHRLTGLFLCAGALLFAWGLLAVASGGAGWERFAAFCGSLVGMILLCAWTWSLLYHLCNGVYHLLHDAGRRFGPPRREREFAPAYWKDGWIVIALSLVLTALVWVFLVLHATGGAA